MKQSEMVAALMGGQKLCVGEYRDFEVKEFPDQRKPGQFNVVTRTFVLMGRETVSVEHFLERGKRATDAVRPTIAVGAKVVVRFDTFTRDRFGTKASGSIEPITT